MAATTTAAAAGAPLPLPASLGPFGHLSAWEGDDGQETGAKFSGYDNVEEKVGGRTNGVEEVGDPTEIIQLVRV